MKKFTGEVQYAEKNEIYLRRQHTHVWIYYLNNDAPEVETGATVEIKAKYDFPKTQESYTTFNGSFETRTVRGRYYLHNTEIKEFNIL